MGMRDATLDAFHDVLNRPSRLPQQAYRRNVGEYSLVSYVNNITGALLSENAVVAAVFVARAAAHIGQSPPRSGYEGYYDLVNSYLGHVVYLLQIHYPSLDLGRYRVPSALLHAGPQTVPAL
jgi:hypothetical protein